MLVGVSMLLLSAGALAELLESVRNGRRVRRRPDAAALALHRCLQPALRRRARLGGGAAAPPQPVGRVLMLALALVNLLVLPFGTALGIYALWVLLTNDGRRLFESRSRTAASDRR